MSLFKQKYGDFIFFNLIVFLLVVGCMYWFFHTRPMQSRNKSNIEMRPKDAPPLMAIEHVLYRKTSEFDPGTIRIYVRNTTDTEMSFKKVLLDELPISVWGVDLTVDNTASSVAKNSKRNQDEEKDTHGSLYESAAARFSGKRILWAKLTPASIPPGCISEFSAKLVNPLPRPMKVELISKSDEIFSAIVRPVDPMLRITAITFSEDLKHIYVYMEGMIEQSLEISGLEFNGTWLDGKEYNSKELSTKRLQQNTLWISSPILRKNEKQLAVLSLDSPLIQGDYVTIRIICQHSAAAEERVRVFSGFPIASEHGRGNSDLNMDDNVYVLQPNWVTIAEPKHAAPSSPPAAAQHANLLFVCHMHRYGGNKERCAMEAIRRHFIYEQFDPHHPTVNHLCRIRIENGCALFAETGDILRMNPAVTTGLSIGKANEPPETTTARLARYAYVAAQPRPFQVLADTSAFGSDRDPATPEEFRRRVYATIGCGAKGLLYRDRTANNPAALGLKDEIRRINAELAHIRKYLAIADVVDCVKASSQNNVTAYLLLAGQDNLILVLIEHGIDKTSDELLRNDSQISRHFEGKFNSFVLPLPKWFVCGNILHVTPAGLKKSNLGSYSEGIFQFPASVSTSAFLIRRMHP